jgi:hypothetical protein
LGATDENWDFLDPPLHLIILDGDEWFHPHVSVSARQREVIVRCGRWQKGTHSGTDKRQERSDTREETQPAISQKMSPLGRGVFRHCVRHAGVVERLDGALV